MLAEDLDLPLRGVNLPNHFVLAFLGGHDAAAVDERNVLFYVNAFSQGDILGRSEIDEFLEKIKVPPQPSFYQPCTNVDIIRRVLNNLANSYAKQGDPDRASDLEQLRTALGRMG